MGKIAILSIFKQSSTIQDRIVTLHHFYIKSSKFKLPTTVQIINTKDNLMNHADKKEINPGMSNINEVT